MKNKEKKSAEELLKEIDEDDKISRKKLQKRKIEVVEFEDGSYSLIGFAWNLPLKNNEIRDAFESWLSHELVEGIPIKNL